MEFTRAGFAKLVAEATEEARLEFVQFAKKTVAEEIAAGRTLSRRYRREVDGKMDAQEDAVRIPGVIKYNFDFWGNVIPFVLDFLAKAAPSDSGRYRMSFFVLSDRRLVTDFEGISRNAEVVISNDQPYSRKVEVGHTKFSHGDHRIFEDARQAVLAEFKDLVEAQLAYITFGQPYSGLAKGEIPYRLHGHRGFTRGHKKFARRYARKDVAEGELMTYPSLVLREDSVSRYR